MDNQQKELANIEEGGEKLKKEEEHYWKWN